MLARGRDDDQPEIIHRRLELYRTTTQPLLDHYANLLIPINGTGAVADVQNRILSALTEQAGRAPAGTGEAGGGDRVVAPEARRNHCGRARNGPCGDAIGPGRWLSRYRPTT